MMFKDILRKIVIGGLFIVPFVPLIVINQFFFPFITGKNFVFRILVEVLFASWAVLALLDAQYRPKRGWLLYAFSIFLGVVLIADAFGQNAFKAFWSNFERMEGGIALIHLFAYFVVLASVGTEKLFARLAATSLGVSLIIGIYGLLQIGGLLTIHQGGVRVDATLGNATYLAAYMLFHIFIALFMLARARLSGVWKWALWIMVALDSTILIYTATRGTTLGLLGGLLLAGLIILVFGKNVSKSARRGAMAAAVGVLVLVAGFFFVRDVPAVRENEILGRFAGLTLSEGNTRFEIWSLAWQGFQERPILGCGHEGFNFVFNKYYDPKLYSQEPLFDRAHNVFMDWLVAGGILGLLTYLSLFAIAVWYLAFKKEQLLSITERALLIGLLAGYFFHNLFVFDNLTSAMLFASVLAYLSVVYERNRAPLFSGEFNSRAVSQIAAPVAGVALLAVLYFVNYPGMATASGLIQSISAQQEGISKNIEWMQKSWSYQSIGKQEVAEQLIQASVRLAQSNVASQEEVSQIATLARDAMQKEVEGNPDDARLRLFFGSFLRQFGDLSGADAQLTKARDLSPKKQLIIFEQGVLTLTQGDRAGAEALFKEAYELEPQFDTARIYYAVVLIENGKRAQADQLLTEHFGSVIVDNPYLINAYIETKQYDRLVSIFEIRIEKNPGNAQYLLQLADAYRLAGRINDALAAAERAGNMDASVKSAADQFIQQIKGGN